MLTNWNVFEKKVACSLLTFSRNRLRVKLETCIVSAFLMVDEYYKTHTESPYNFFIILVASLFSSCKMNESAHTMQQIYSELLHCCRDSSNKIGAEKLKTCLGIDSFEERQISDREINDINQCELDLLETTGFDMSPDSPFNHINSNVIPFLNGIPPENANKIKQNLVKNVFMYFSSQIGSELPNNVIAVLSTESAFRNICDMPEEIINWIHQVESSDVGDILNNAREQRAREAAAMAQRRQNQTPVTNPQ